jgi:rare lipoprotein A
LCLFVVSGCAVLIPHGDRGYRESGIASWYGGKFHGRKTANGETYDMYGLTAAHKTLPFGTLLRVTDIETGRFVHVRVNDRGPFVHGRIIDLSFGAAEWLGIGNKGVANVIIEIVEPGLRQREDRT